MYLKSLIIMDKQKEYSIHNMDEWGFSLDNHFNQDGSLKEGCDYDYLLGLSKEKQHYIFEKAGVAYQVKRDAEGQVVEGWNADYLRFREWFATDGLDQFLKS